MIEPVFVFIRPQMGENIGAAARAMLNFGLTHMRIVAPRDGWPNPKAIAMASGAGCVLDQAQLFSDVSDAIADCHYIFATTARNRELVKPVMAPKRAAQIIEETTSSGKKVAILFGPERSGLENDDLVFANSLISVPVNPDFPSLNLAQSALLIAYEWQMLKNSTPNEVMNYVKTEPATALDIHNLANHFEERLEQVGFFHPPEKVAHMKLNFRNMWARLGLTRAEIQTFHGILKQIFLKINEIERKK